MNKFIWWGLESGYEQYDSPTPTLLPYDQRFPGISFHFRSLIRPDIFPERSYAMITEEDSSMVSTLLNSPNLSQRVLNGKSSEETLHVYEGSINTHRFLILREEKKHSRARYDISVLYVSDHLLAEWSRFLDIEEGTFMTKKEWEERDNNPINFAG